MLFELSNPRNGRVLHCGVLEFVAEEGMALLPHWMMENLGLSEGFPVVVTSCSLVRGHLVKLRPQTKIFLDISNPRAVLENTLRNFSALTVHTTIRINYNERNYDIDVVDVQPANAQHAICILDADVKATASASIVL